MVLQQSFAPDALIDVCADPEFAFLSQDESLRVHSFTAWEFRDMKTIRKQQQEAYSALVRMRRRQ